MRKSIAMVALAAFAWPLVAGERLYWSELGRVIVEREVSAPLADGKRVQGEVLAVREEGILMHVRKTSSKQFGRGQQLVPREAVTELKIIRRQGPFKLVGGILGTIGGGAAVVGIGFVTAGAGALPAALLLWPMCGVGGYYAGKAADKRTTVISVMPEGEHHAGL